MDHFVKWSIYEVIHFGQQGQKNTINFRCFVRMSTGKNTANYRKRHVGKIGTVKNGAELTASCCDAMINKFLSPRNNSLVHLLKSLSLFLS